MNTQTQPDLAAEPVTTDPAGTRTTPREPTQDEDRAEQQIQALEDLAQLGVTLARALGRLATAAAERANPDLAEITNLANTFDRAARSARSALALEGKFRAERRARAKQREAAEDARLIAAERAALEERHLQAKLRRSTAARTVNRIIAMELPVERASRLRIAADRYFYDADAFAFLDRTIAESVGDACHFLGIKPRWQDWAHEAWAREAPYWPPDQPPGSPANAYLPAGQDPP